MSFKKFGLTDTGACHLAKAFKTNSTVTKIDVSNNSITDQGAHVLADSLLDDLPLQARQHGPGSMGYELSMQTWCNVNHTSLYCGYPPCILCAVTMFLCIWLALPSSGRHAQPQALKLRDSHLNPNPSFLHLIKEFDISGNQLKVEFCREFSEFLTHHSSVTSIHIGSTIDCKGCAFLARALSKNASLVELDLSDNKIKDEGAACVWESLKLNNTLQKIDMSWNTIGDESCKALAQALGMNQTVTWMNMQFNAIGNEGAGYVQLGIESNPHSALTGHVAPTPTLTL